MKGRALRAVALAGGILLFSCLLISGGWRLIASPQREAQPVRVAVQAALCHAPADETGGEQGCAVRYPRTLRKVDAAPPDAHADARERIASGADANGNVLRQVSYLRSVYQAFPLGDGFA